MGYVQVGGVNTKWMPASVALDIWSFHPSCVCFDSLQMSILATRCLLIARSETGENLLLPPQKKEKLQKAQRVYVLQLTIIFESFRNM